ncbi:Cysteine+desulfurase+NifS [Methylocapsa aurea]
MIAAHDSLRLAEQDQGVINLDANANAATTIAVQEAVLAAMRSGAANPSSGHTLGELGRVILAQARDAVSALIEGSTEEGVYFTAGCTEANNTVLRSVIGRTNATIITSPVEHSSILRPAEASKYEGVRLCLIEVDENGVVLIDHLAELLGKAEGEIILSVQGGNSETGVLQPISEIAELVANRSNVLFHSDVAQAFGKVRLTIGRPYGPDVLTLSGHKIHAPMGIGAVLTAPDERRVRPLIIGGGQENGRRAGTQALPLIAGLSAAARDRFVAFGRDKERMTALRDRLEYVLRQRLPDIVVNGSSAPRLPNTSNIRFPGIDAIAMLANLDAFGIICSQGSACTSGRPEPSHVLTAMGLVESEAFSSVRFSVSPLNTEHQIDTAAAIISEVARNLRTQL